MHDWLPRTRSARIAMAKRWLQVFEEEGHGVFAVTVSEMADLAMLTANADLSNQAAIDGQGNRTLIAAAADDEKKLVTLMRRLQRRIRSVTLSNAQIVNLGLNPHDTIRTDHTIVTELVDFIPRLNDASLQIAVDFWIAGADHRAKPFGYDGAVVIHAVLDAPPAGYDELVHHAMASRTPHILHFDLPERGKTVYIALCWQNERGIRGAWSDIKSIVIP